MALSSSRVERDGVKWGGQHLAGEAHLLQPLIRFHAKGPTDKKKKKKGLEKA